MRRIERVTPRLVRVTFAGPELEGLTIEHPAASVRLLLPSPSRHEVEVPTWSGNEFLLADGSRPVIRTFTPRRVDPTALELDLEIVVHGGGVASAWADAARPGDPAAISGPGRGYAFDRDAPAFLLTGDETAIPVVEKLANIGNITRKNTPLCEQPSIRAASATVAGSVRKNAAMMRTHSTRKYTSNASAVATCKATTKAR